MKLLNVFVLASLMSFTAMGCSSTGESGLSKSSTLASLNTNDAKILCTWMLEETGGAGKETTCTTSGTGTTGKKNHTQEECEKSFDDFRTLHDLGCEATVEEAETCTAETKKDACGSQPTCDALEKRFEECEAKSKADAGH